MGILEGECDGFWGCTGVTGRFADPFGVLPLYNGSVRFTTLHDTTTELLVSLRLVMPVLASWDLVFLVVSVWQCLSSGCPPCHKFQIDTYWLSIIKATR